MSCPGAYRPRPRATAPGARTRGGVRPVLAGLLALVLAGGLAVGLTWEPPPPELPRLEAAYEDGRTQADSLRIPVAAPEYEHERLTVAPRFGSDGVVALVESFLLAGNVVYLNHGGGLLTAYFHLSEQLVEAGDTVTAGTPIGRVGATGRVTGPHLHWVVRYGTTSVDPRSLLELP